MHSSLFTLLSLLSVTSSFPFQRRTANITSVQYNQFDLFSQYAGAAYCFDNVQANATTIQCAAEQGNCSSIEGKSKITKGFTNVGDSKTRGFVSVDDTNKLIVVSIQGTQISNFASIVTDIKILKTETSLCGAANTTDGCKVHTGFYEAATQVKEIVYDAVNEAHTSNPDYQVVTTGHSLGAAVAALLGTMLRNDGYIVDMYTFGQPHLGPADINTYIQNQAPAHGNNYRVTHGADLVPQVPPHNLLGGWDHFYPEYFISKIDGMPSISDVAVVIGNLYSTAGNEGDSASAMDILEGVPQHRNYFGAITSCVEVFSSS